LFQNWENRLNKPKRFLRTMPYFTTPCQHCSFGAGVDLTSKIRTNRMLALLIGGN